MSSSVTAKGPSTSLLKPAVDDLDARTINIARALAMDAVQQANSGHPGTPMALAPVAHLIYQEFLRHDPRDPDWAGRDHFVLSSGHASMLLYAQLYLTGYGLSLDDLRAFRQFESRTPGHPEYSHTPGVETTTGPLGQGFANAVGMAIADRRAASMWDEEGTGLFDRTTYVLCSDGDLEEGISHEAASFAGHQRLGALVYVWDDNHISIEGDTAIAWSEDVLARFESYGWHTLTVADAEDLDEMRAALTAARDERERPSLIALRSHIGFPSPNKVDTGEVHGSPLGADEIKLVKVILGLDPDKSFDVPDDVLAYARKAVDRGAQLHEQWDKAYAEWSGAHPDRHTERDRILHRRLPDGLAAALPAFEAGKPMATREAFGAVLNAVAPVMPELFGGSADLAPSNNTTMKGQEPALPGTPGGRQMHWGIREHMMGSTMNGMALTQTVRPFGGTFLIFSDYMRPAVRLAALMRLPVTYIWTHDSIGLGEDGPTHQPIEQLAALRAIPGLDVVRPADANETAVAFRTILENTDRPAGFCLTRQKLDTVDRSAGFASAEGVAKGAYVLVEASSGTPKVILIGTGSEVEICVAARDLLEAAGVPTRVVSMPCREWFEAQEQSYRSTVLPTDVKARVSVEAAVGFGWRDIVGDSGEIVSIDRFGASAPAAVLYQQFGLTPDRVAAAAQRSLSTLGALPGAPTGN